MQPGKEILDRYVKAVLAAPESLHLTATREPGEFWQRHVLDALKVLELLPLDWQKRDFRVLDLGSGNGIPGIPISVAVQNWRVDLLDSDAKKCGFLDVFCKNNAIKNVSILPGRAEVLAHKQQRESYDIVFARALSKLPVAIELAAPFVKVGGHLIVPHGTTWEEELKKSMKATKELGVLLKEVKSYSIAPKLIFHALVFEKHYPTPENYPRSTGIPAKRPL